ncbi:MAG: WbqC family protein [Siphonobacter aquaeclarae]|nr:WbqC family protein [Siphonobacter aquaeclarae]
MREYQGVVLELPYLPSLEFWTCCGSVEEVWLESRETFQKQTYRNRCRILTAGGVDTLIVPVLEGRSRVKTEIRDIRIDYGQPWLKRHWGAIESAYRKAPFFDYFEDRFRRVYESKPDFLYDLNWEFLTVCRELLGTEQRFVSTETYEKSYEKPLLDARGLISPKTGYETRPFYVPAPYRQNFGEQFFPNLSILDLLFCHGREAKTILKASVKNTAEKLSLNE